jgi:hypothetical protein
MKQILCVSILLITFSLFSQIPEYEFITEPTELMENFYDYMPGSYCGLPIQVEEDGSVYIVFHARSTPASTRREYYAYIDASGNVTNVATIGTEDIHEGYAGIDLDPVTGDPFTAWHGNFDTTTADLEVVMTYDLYHLGMPGNWIDPFPIPGNPWGEILWPEVHVGPSPDPAKRRVYVIGKISDYPNENIIIGYADFDVNDLNVQSNLEWTFRTIELLNQWNNSPIFIRPNLSCSVSDDGKIALMGYVTVEDSSDSLVIFLNDNFGVGEFEYFFQEAHYNVWNPFPTQDELYFAPYFCNHQNSMFHDNNSKISFLGAMNLLVEPNLWFADLNVLYTKIFTFDTTIQDFSFYDLYIEGLVPDDDTPMIPWDLNEDGIVDSIGPNGEIVYVEGWPIYYFDAGMGFAENNFKLTKNEEKFKLVTADFPKCPGNA